jgi:hypothetical protein
MLTPCALIIKILRLMNIDHLSDWFNPNAPSYCGCDLSGSGHSRASLKIEQKNGMYEDSYKPLFLDE